VHAIVLVKQVPDTAQLSPKNDALQIMAEGGPRIVNPWDEYAIEIAIQLKEEHGGKVTLICVGEPEAVDALKTGLAMGADEAILLSDPLFREGDTLATARVLAAAIAKLDPFDLILSGKTSIDGNSGATAVQLAAILDVPAVSYVAELGSLDLEDNTLEAVRLLENRRETVSSRLPSVVSVVKEICEPRYPSFIGIRRAASASIPVWGIDDLELNLDEVGLRGSQVVWSEVVLAENRERGVEIIGGSPKEAAETLISKLAEEKLL
jgi:electron transfer flavoprotein beta subunit